MPRQLTAAQMRATEQAAIARGAVTGLALMERAGLGVTEAIFAQWPELAKGKHHALILCGPGNNGGDGFVVARLLRERGWDVSVACTTSLAQLTGDAATNAALVARSDADLTPYQREHLAHRLQRPGHIVVIDALLGIGQNRNADDILRPYIQAMDVATNVGVEAQLHTVSIDVPTGYETDTGALCCSAPFEPDLTVTFHAEKPVHAILRNHGIKVVIVDIGLSSSIV